MTYPTNNAPQHQQQHSAPQQWQGNGVSQPADPMDSNTPNPFAVIDQKNGIVTPQQVQPTNPQGMPSGTENFQAFNPTQSNPAQGVDSEGGSPMDKWFKTTDNSTQGGQPEQKPEGQPSTPEEYQSIFASSKIDEFHSLVNKRDFVGEGFTPEVQENFRNGDFSAMPDIMNKAVQQGVALAAFMSSKVADKGVNGILSNFQQSVLPELLNSHQLNSMWKSPEFNDFNSPAMQPMVQMATNHVRSMYPNASPQEVQSKAMEMMQDYSKQLSSVQFTPQGGKGSQVQEQQQPTMSDMEMLFK